KFQIGGVPVQSGNIFYKKVQISDLCFCIIYKENEEIKRSYHNYLSDNLSHDSLFVINYFRALLSLERMKNFKKVNFWSNYGPHFKNCEILYSFLVDFWQNFTDKKISINFFNEKHKKTDVYGRLDASNYLPVSYSVKTVKDSRVDKYAPAFPIQRDCLGDIMGPASKKVQDGRIRMLRQSGIDFGSG
ncbi:hypothetical protein BB560_004191, partial [Smittium megazygosporum]